MITQVNWKAVAHYYAQSYCERSKTRMCGRCQGCIEVRNSWHEMRRAVKLHPAEYVTH